MPLWNRDTAKHLLSRTLIGYSKKDLDVALSYLKLEEFVDKELLATKPLPAPPGTWITEVPVANDPNQGTRYRDFTYWWYTLMLNQGTSMQEKMVLFLHNHYTSQRSRSLIPSTCIFSRTCFARMYLGICAN